MPRVAGTSGGRDQGRETEDRLCDRSSTAEGPFQQIPSGQGRDRCEDGTEVLEIQTQ